jgi:hypothetical protein
MKRDSDETQASTLGSMVGSLASGPLKESGYEKVLTGAGPHNQTHHLLYLPHPTNFFFSRQYLSLGFLSSTILIETPVHCFTTRPHQQLPPKYLVINIQSHLLPTNMDVGLLADIFRFAFHISIFVAPSDLVTPTAHPSIDWALHPFDEHALNERMSQAYARQAKLNPPFNITVSLLGHAMIIAFIAGACWYLRRFLRYLASSEEEAEEE